MKIKIFIFFVLYSQCFAENKFIDFNELSKSLEKAESQTIDKSKFYENKKAEETAKKLHKIFKSKEVQNRIKKAENKLKKEVFITKYKKSAKEQADSNELKIHKDEKVLVFLSSTVPESTIRNYLYQIDRIKCKNTVFVLRGFIGGIKKMVPTLKYLSSILLKDPYCDPTESKCIAYDVNFLIDPESFSEFNINKVPAFGYKNKSEKSVLYGDISLSYAFKKFKSVSNSDYINENIKKLENKGFYNESK
ncbi:MAG: hypothetical protein GY714_09120 [Desulfobacterales bacterium]|nr:hypothetical protein [Desulfobacterales bacterium]